VRRATWHHNGDGRAFRGHFFGHKEDLFLEIFAPRM
jgi:hypothetical protein